MISVHACPLAKLGGRDSGGMNVYVRELARELGSRGIEVDVFTRWREPGDPRVQQLGPNARVIHVESGPIRYIPKSEVYARIGEFTEKVVAFIEREGRTYDAIHSHYWLSALVARDLAERYGLPVVQMFHTLGLVRAEVMDEDTDGEMETRIGIERQAVKDSDGNAFFMDVTFDTQDRITYVVLTTLLKGPPGDKKLIDASSMHQICGRAGRPQFDTRGYVYALAHEDDVKIARWQEKYDQIPENTKDPGLLAAKKKIKKKMQEGGR